MARAKRRARSRAPSMSLGARIEQAWIRRQLRAGQRMRLYERLGKFISNGVPVTAALDQIYAHASLEGRKPKRAAAVAVDQWRAKVRDGKRLAEALEGWAAPAELAVLNAGEIAGRLDRAIDEVIFMHVARKRMRSAMAGVLYPLALIASTCFFLYIFGTRVVPAFAQILPVDQWTGSGAKMASLAYFVQHDMAGTIGMLAALIAVSLFSLPRWTGSVRQRFDKLPPWSIYRIAVGCGFMTSLGALLHAGVPAPEALRMMYMSASPWYQERLAATRRAMLNGARNLGDALHQTGFGFPSSEMIIDIRSYASLDGFEEMLERLSRQWLDDSVVMIERQMGVLRNVAIAVMGFVFIWIVQGMFALQQQISSAAH